MIKAFPKIFTLGTVYVADIFNGEVEITEKIDGSQFSFGKVDGELFIRSKGARLFPENPNGMFKKGIEYVVSIKDRLPDDLVFNCEYLGKPKHNVLAYDRTPKNNLILFGVSKKDSSYINEEAYLEKYSELLDIEHVPVLFKGKIDNPEKIKEIIEKVSVLGGQNMEGCVVKRFVPFMFGDQIMPLMSGKYVSEKFKEVHRSDWKKDHTATGGWQSFCQGYKSEARWNKAIQHLRDKGELDGSPKDIGPLLKEISRDIIEEEKEIIKEYLWKLFNGEVTRAATSGFPQWYKDELLKGNINVPKIERLSEEDREVDKKYASFFGHY